MTSRDLLKTAMEIGEEHGQQGGGASFITQMSITFGFWAYPGEGQDRLKFWKRCENQAEAGVIKAEVQARLDEAGVVSFDGKPAIADYCLRVWASGDWLGRDPKDFDDNQFYAKWQWAKKGDVDTCVSLILDSVEENSLPLGKKFWGRYILKANPYHVNLGEKGKKEGKDGNMYWPNFVLPVEIFADEAAAKEAVVDTGSGGGSADNVSYDALSDKAKSQFNDANSFLAQASQIQEWYNKALKGEEIPSKPIKDYLSPKDGSISEGSAKLYIADVWGWESSDVDLLLNEIPF